MKKLIIVAAGMLALSASAATCNWSADGIYSYGTDTLNDGYAAYFFETATLSKDDAIAAINNKSFSFTSDGIVDDALADGELYGTTTGYANKETINGYLLVFDNASASAATHYYISDVDSATTGASGQAANIYFDASATANTSSWSTIGSSVPEPTSGLLLLLGVAGLALRRKRA